MPQRLQLRRTRGGSLPPGAVSVARPSRFGNPHPVGRPCPLCGDQTVHDRPGAVAAYRAWLAAKPLLVNLARDTLRGRSLACWCSIPEPGEEDTCHAALLLAVVAGEHPARATIPRRSWRTDRKDHP